MRDADESLGSMVFTALFVAMDAVTPPKERKRHMSGSIASGPYRTMDEVVPPPAPYVEPPWKRAAVVGAFLAGCAANAGATVGLGLLGPNWIPASVIMGLGALVSLVIGLIGMADSDMAFKFCREWSTRKRVIAIGWGFLFLTTYAAYRVFRWIARGQ